MKDKYKAIEHASSGEILCDNPECDFKFTGVNDAVMNEFINMPCPECSENLLTREDYNHHQTLLKVVRWVNILLFPYMFLTGGRKGKQEDIVGYHHHAGKTTITRENE